MIVDLRIYTVRPGQVENFVALYRDYAWPLQQKYLGRCLGWYTSFDGVLNQVVHLWAYDSMRLTTFCCDGTGVASGIGNATRFFLSSSTRAAR